MTTTTTKERKRKIDRENERMETQMSRFKNVVLMGRGYRKSGDLDYMFLKSDFFPPCAREEPLIMQ